MFASCFKPSRTVSECPADKFIAQRVHIDRPVQEGVSVDRADLTFTIFKFLAFRESSEKKFLERVGMDKPEI